MTILEKAEFKCAVCGSTSEHVVVLSIHSSGYPDLDTRPPQDERFVSAFLVQCCPSCLYCNTEISQLNGNAKEIVNSQGYKTLLKNPQRIDGIRSYIRKAYIDKMNGKLVESAWAVIHAAWGCDDLGWKKKAITARTKALELIDRANKQGLKISDEEGEDIAIKVDLMRRIGNLQDAQDVLNSCQKSHLNDVIQKILKYQEYLISRGDTDCHTIDEAIRIVEQRSKDIL